MMWWEKQPKNRTGKKVTAQKLENAKKLGVLSLSEHGLKEIPVELVQQPAFHNKLRTLDLSHNQLQTLGPSLATLLVELKSLNLDHNNFCAGSLSDLSQLPKLQIVSCSHNQLGIPPGKGHDKNNSNNKTGGGAAAALAKLAVKAMSSPSKGDDATATSNTMSPEEREQVSLEQSVPPLPVSLKQLFLAHNHLVRIPNSILQSTTAVALVKLELLDLNENQITVLPPTISVLVGLHELRLDQNQLSTLPAEIGLLKKLKVLSLRNNQINVKRNVVFSPSHPQPIPATLFTDTPLIDLNLHGNAMTNTQLNQFDGFAAFLERRRQVKTKTMTDLDVCGLR